MTANSYPLSLNINSSKYFKSVLSMSTYTVISYVYLANPYSLWYWLVNTWKLTGNDS